MIDKKVSAQQLLELKDIIDAYLTLGINMDMRYSDFLKEIKFPKTEMILKDVLTKLFNIIKKKNLNELFSFEAQILNLYHIFLNQEGTEVDNDDDERDRFLENTFSILELFECVLNKALDNSLYFFDIYQLYNLLFEFYNDYEVEIIKPEKVSSIFSKNNSKKSHKIIRNKDKIEAQQGSQTNKKVRFDLSKNEDIKNNKPSVDDIWKDWSSNFKINESEKKSPKKSIFNLKPLPPKKNNDNKPLKKSINDPILKKDMDELDKLIKELDSDTTYNKKSKDNNLMKLDNKTKSKDDIIGLQSKMLLDDDALIDEYARSYQELVLYRDYFLKDYVNLKIEFIDKTIGFLVIAAKLIGCSEDDLKTREISDISDVSAKQENSWREILNMDVSDRNNKIKTILIYLIDKYIKHDKSLTVDRFLNIFADFKNENALSSCKDILRVLINSAKQIKHFVDEPILDEKLENLGFYDWEGVIDCIKFVSRMVNLIELLESGSYLPPGGRKDI